MATASRAAKYGQAYVLAVIFVGLAVVGTSIFQLATRPVPLQQWFLLAALTLISGSATIKLPSIPASISISETFVFTAVLLYGPAAGTLIVALDGLVMSFWIARRVREPHRALFNMSAPAVSAWFSAHLFFRLAGVPPIAFDTQAPSLDRMLPALVVFAVAYFGLNSWLITLAIVPHTRTSALRVWRSNFVWLSINYFCGASVAILLVMYTRNVDIRYVGVIVPLLFVLYFTFKTSMGRVEDAQKHVEQVNQLYLSTIETLAMAIDAKDQITHGHIRRVQQYAIGLARQIGVTDERLIKAIEAAALLHDTGKLAVPEHILNKPGKLTPAEFAKMKVHASAGADILSAIDFPYPVVPIVRHHHEHWDGGGYPSGLKGTQIPIGARILAVVDCFDALTSDRPYRVRLSDDEALRILMEARGSMYDPLMVDTFVTVHKEFARESVPTRSPAEPLNEIAKTSRSTGAVVGTPRLGDIGATADEMSTLYELVLALASPPTSVKAEDVFANHLRKLVPFAVCVVYIYEPVTDELVVLHASGEIASNIIGLRMRLGRGVSGWVAANRQTIANSNPALDLREIATAASSRLRSCLSVPLLHDDQLVGVLSLYSSRSDGFTEDNQRIIEAAAQQIARAFKGAAPGDVGSEGRANDQRTVH